MTEGVCKACEDFCVDGVYECHGNCGKYFCADCVTSENDSRNITQKAYDNLHAEQFRKYWEKKKAMADKLGLQIKPLPEKFAAKKKEKPEKKKQEGAEEKDEDDSSSSGSSSEDEDEDDDNEEFFCNECLKFTDSSLLTHPLPQKPTTGDLLEFLLNTEHDGSGSGKLTWDDVEDAYKASELIEEIREDNWKVHDDDKDYDEPEDIEEKVEREVQAILQRGSVTAKASKKAAKKAGEKRQRTE
jgi:hypothetical protein